MDRTETLNEAVAIAAEQAGGTLATTHAEDGTPYVTFVLFHMRDTGEVLFGSAARPQHTRNIAATPEVSFLVDNREVISGDWAAFNRVVIEGRALEIAKDDARYAGLLDELRQKNHMAANFTEAGILFCLSPRRILLNKGLDATRHTVNYE